MHHLELQKILQKHNTCLQVSDLQSEICGFVLGSKEPSFNDWIEIFNNDTAIQLTEEVIEAIHNMFNNIAKQIKNKINIIPILENRSLSKVQCLILWVQNLISGLGISENPFILFPNEKIKTCIDILKDITQIKQLGPEILEPSELEYLIATVQEQILILIEILNPQYINIALDNFTNQ